MGQVGERSSHRRNVSVVSCSFLILMRASSVMGPHWFMSISYVWYLDLVSFSGFCRRHKRREDARESDVVRGWHVSNGACDWKTSCEVSTVVMVWATEGRLEELTPRQ
jgi:hypothetical protein